MRLVERLVKLDRGVSEVEILFAGCLHIGHAGTQESIIRAMVEYVAQQPNRRVVLLGDLTDGISVSDPRFNPREVASWLSTEDLSNRILLEAERACDILAPIRDRIDGLIEGNHERKPRTVSQVDLHRVLAKGLGVESLGLSAILRYSFIGRDRGGSEPLTFYCEHGSGGAGTVGVVINKLVKKAKDFPGLDAYLGAHHHKGGISTAESLVFDAAKKRLTTTSPIVATVGTFMRYHELGPGRETYGETYGMPVPTIGPMKLVVYPWGRKGLPRFASASAPRVSARMPWWG